MASHHTQMDWPHSYDGFLFLALSYFRSSSALISKGFIYKRKEPPNHNVYFESGFLQEHAVSVKIVNHERRRRLGRATFNAYLYTVEVDHGDYNWTVFRT